MSSMDNNHCLRVIEADCTDERPFRWPGVRRRTASDVRGRLTDPQALLRSELMWSTARP